MHADVAAALPEAFAQWGGNVGRGTPFRMKKTEMTELVLAAKKAKKLTWAALAERVGMSEMYVASAATAKTRWFPKRQRSSAPRSTSTNR
jgi:hypothetical protein